MLQSKYTKSISECTTMNQMGCSRRRPHSLPLLLGMNRKLWIQFTWAHHRKLHHITKLKLSQTIFNMTIWQSAYCLHSHQICKLPPQSPDLKPLGCSGRCTSDKSVATVWFYYVNIDYNLNIQSHSITEGQILKWGICCNVRCNV